MHRSADGQGAGVKDGRQGCGVIVVVGLQAVIAGPWGRGFGAVSSGLGSVVVDILTGKGFVDVGNYIFSF